MRCPLVIGALIAVAGCSESRDKTAPTADPPPAEFSAALPSYPGAIDASSIRLPGRPSWQAGFATEDPPARVAQFYASAFRRAGFQVADNQLVAGGAHASLTAERVDGQRIEVIARLNEGQTRVQIMAMNGEGQSGIRVEQVFCQPDDPYPPEPCRNRPARR